MSVPSMLEVRHDRSLAGNNNYRQAYYAAGSRYGNYQSCQRETAESLRKHGFCLVETHVGRSEQAMDVAEGRRFALSQMAKHFMSESAEEGYVVGRHKEMFHFTSRSGSTQKPDYWHLPTAPGVCLKTMTETGALVFNGINAHVLSLLRNERFEQEAFPDDADYKHWINAVEHSSAHVMTSFLYQESNRATLHAEAHVDKGLLSICTNPSDLEVCVEGQWVPLGPQAPGVIAVLCGYTLERATNGLFHACRHRVRNTGERRSRVMKIRLDPSLVVKPASVIANVPALFLEDLPPPPDELQVGELVESFTQRNTSVNAATLQSLPISVNAEDIIGDTDLGYFDMLPSNLVLSVFDWLRDIRDLYRLSLVNQAMRQIANNDTLCIAAAESARIDWGAALDRIDRGVESHARARDRDRQPMVVSDLLESVASRWTGILGTELTDKKMRMNDLIVFRIRDQTGEETFFKTKFGTRFQIAFNTYAQRKGVSVESLRFLFQGERIKGKGTPYTLELEIDDQLDCMLEQSGD